MIRKRYPIATHKQRGIALFLCLFAIFLASAIALGLMTMSDTETVVASNYRDTQLAYFAARGGLEEARARIGGGTGAITPPSAVPSSAAQNIIYITNPTGGETVNPTATSTTFSSNYFDDELCQEKAFASGTLAYGTNGIPCTAVPSGSAWYKTVASTAPYTATAGAMPYKWVRIQAKTNSVYSGGALGGVGSGTGITAQSLVCWDSVNQHEMVTTSASCTGSYLPIYVLTSLAVTAGGYSVANGGSRRMLQMEVYPPVVSGNYPYAVFATGTGCGAVTLSGTVTTDSFNSSNGTYAATHTNSGGNFGTNGSVTNSGTVTAYGTYYSTLPASQGACPANAYLNSGTWTVSGGASQLSAAYTAPPVPAPTGTPTSAAQVLGSGCTNFPTGCTGSGGNITLSPGTYNALISSSTTTINLTAGTYNFYSVTASGSFTFNVSSGPVIINFTSPGAPIVASGSWVSNSSGIPSNLTVYYNGTGSFPLSGSASSYAVIDAPNAAVVVSGTNDWYGAIVGKTVTASSGSHFHYDTALASGSGSSSTGPVVISFHELMY